MPRNIAHLFFVLSFVVWVSFAFGNEIAAPDSTDELTEKKPEQSTQFYRTLNACAAASQKLQSESSDFLCEDTFLFNMNLPSRQQYFYRVNPDGIELYHFPQAGKSMSQDGKVWKYRAVEIDGTRYEMKVNNSVNSNDRERIHCPRVGNADSAKVNSETGNTPAHEQKVQEILSAHFKGYVDKSFLELWKSFPKQRPSAKENLKTIICECAKLPKLRDSVVELSKKLESKDVSSIFTKSEKDAFERDLSEATSCLMLISKLDLIFESPTTF